MAGGTAFPASRVGPTVAADLAGGLLGRTVHDQAISTTSSRGCWMRSRPREVFMVDFGLKTNPRVFLDNRNDDSRLKPNGRFFMMLPDECAPAANVWSPPDLRALRKQNKRLTGSASG